MISRRHRRSFTWIDAVALVFATAFGLFMTKSVLDGHDMILMFDGGRYAVRGFRRWGLGSVPLFTSWSLMLLALRLKAPPSRRRLLRGPGIVTGVVVALLTISAFVNPFIHPLLRLKRQTGIQLGWEFGLLQGVSSWLVEVADVAGFAVAATWFALWVGRWWRLEPDWIDRGGRALGCYWIVMFFVCSYYSLAS